MKLYFLGTGTSQGVPMIGCDCDVCRSTDPRNTRFRTHAHVEIGGLNIQIDAAPEFRLQAIKHRIPKIDFIILTHGHADHILGMDDMRVYCEKKGGEAITIYTNEEGEKRMRSIFHYAIRDRAEIYGYAAFKLVRMPKRLELPECVIHSVFQDHGRFETLGLVFEERDTGKRLAYYTDCHSVSEKAEQLAKGADVAVLDGLRQKMHASHMSIEQACDAAKRIGAKQSFLIHMTHHVDHEKVDSTLPDGVRLSYDNLIVEV